MSEWKPALPETPEIDAAILRIVRLGEELENEGQGHMAARGETTDTGFALRWLGQHLQKLVNDGVLDREFDSFYTNQEG